MLKRSWERNTINIGDGMEMLRALPPESVKAAFFDPQYRALNKKLAYGDVDNPNSKMAHVHKLTAMPEWMIKNMIIDIERSLVPWGHLFLWIDKFMLVSGVGLYLGLSDLRPVDMITWDKQRIGMGYRSRRASEYLVVLQKPLRGETRAAGVWRNRSIKDVWAESAPRGGHPHVKPVGLLRTLVECVTEPGDLIIDPAAGSFTIGAAVEGTGRDYMACDLVSPLIYTPA